MWITEERNKESGGKYRWDSAQVALKKVTKEKQIIEEVKDTWNILEYSKKNFSASTISEEVYAFDVWTTISTLIYMIYRCHIYIHIFFCCVSINNVLHLGFAT